MIVQVARREDNGFTVLICDGKDVLGGWRVTKVWIDESEVSEDSLLVYVNAIEVILTK